jgi:hypothetical protein
LSQLCVVNGNDGIRCGNDSPSILPGRSANVSYMNLLMRNGGMYLVMTAFKYLSIGTAQPEEKDRATWSRGRARREQGGSLKGPGIQEKERHKGTAARTGRSRSSRGAFFAQLFRRSISRRFSLSSTFCSVVVPQWMTWPAPETGPPPPSFFSPTKKSSHAAYLGYVLA